MIQIDSSFNIRMTRGDTFIRTFSFKKNGQPFTPNPNDKIRFAMSKGFLGQSSYSLILVKEIPIDTLVWRLDPKDTKNLPYGKYNYDVEITYVDGSVETFLNKKTIELTEEVK